MSTRHWVGQERQTTKISKEINLNRFFLGSGSLGYLSPFRNDLDGVRDGGDAGGSGRRRSLRVDHLARKQRYSVHLIDNEKQKRVICFELQQIGVDLEAEGLDYFERGRGRRAPVLVYFNVRLVYQVWELKRKLAVCYSRQVGFRGENVRQAELKVGTPNLYKMRYFLHFRTDNPTVYLFQCIRQFHLFRQFKFRNCQSDASRVFLIYDLSQIGSGQFVNDLIDPVAFYR